MIKFKHKVRTEGILNRCQVVTGYEYESAEWENDEGEIVQRERILVHLKRGFYFHSTQISSEWMYTKEEVEDDLRKIFYIVEDECVKWAQSRNRRKT